MNLVINILTVVFFSSPDLEDEDPLMEVMLKSVQDPELAPIYEGLPDLG